MSTSENPETPPLTRRQLRELRNTGATPIVQPERDAPADDTTAAPAPESAEALSSESTVASAPESPAPEAAAPEAAAPEAPAPEAPASEEPAPATPAAKKGGVLGGLFGRNKADKAESAPDEETPSADDEPAAADGLTGTADEESSASSPSAPAAPSADRPMPPAAFAPPTADAPDLGVSGLTRRQARAQERIRTAAVPVITPDLEPAAPQARPESAVVSSVPSVDEAVPGTPEKTADDTGSDHVDEPAIFRPSAGEDVAPTTDEDDVPVSTVNPALGSDLLSGETPHISLPPSFDQLIARSGPATGSMSTPNALILSQTPAGVPLVGPVTSTGEVLITGTFELPEGLGSAGHAPGTTDGRDVDAVLLDGELPPASSPTPIAASAAISTVKQPGEIIRPPAPEKGSKLVIGLIITTGALAVAVAVALVLAFTTGVFG